MRKRTERIVEVVPRRHQPTKQEIEEPNNIDATPKELVRAILVPAKVVEKPIKERAR